MCRLITVLGAHSQLEIMSENEGQHYVYSSPPSSTSNGQIVPFPPDNSGLQPQAIQDRNREPSHPKAGKRLDGGVAGVAATDQSDDHPQGPVVPVKKLIRRRNRIPSKCERCRTKKRKCSGAIIEKNGKKWCPECIKDRVEDCKFDPRHVTQLTTARSRQRQQQPATTASTQRHGYSAHDWFSGIDYTTIANDPGNFGNPITTLDPPSQMPYSSAQIFANTLDMSGRRSAHPFSNDWPFLSFPPISQELYDEGVHFDLESLCSANPSQQSFQPDPNAPSQ